MKKLHVAEKTAQGCTVLNLIHTHTQTYSLWCLPCLCVCVLLMSERTSCHSDNKITTGMWHQNVTHVCDSLQAATVCLLFDVQEGRETQTERRRTGTEDRHTVDTYIDRQKKTGPLSPPPSSSPLPSKAFQSSSPPPAQSFLQIFTAMSSFLFLYHHPATKRLIWITPSPTLSFSFFLLSNFSFPLFLLLLLFHLFFLYFSIHFLLLLSSSIYVHNHIAIWSTGRGH